MLWAQIAHVCPPMFDAMFLVWPYGEKPLFIEMVAPKMHIWHGKIRLAIASSVKLAVIGE